MMNSFLMMAVVVTAVLIDLFCGEPANRFHPVAWMGNAIAWARQACPPRGYAVRFIWGCGIVILGSLIVGSAGWLIDSWSSSFLRRTMTASFWPEIVVVFLHAVVLKCCFGIRSLRLAARAVLEPLEKQDDTTARQQLACHLVSRDVDGLSASEISAATIESVAENTSDSVVAPLFFYVIGGLPGAIVYRYINTCDAMLGYRTPQFEWLGKAAARADDVLNLIPARITAGLMVAASIPSVTVANVWRTWMLDARRTASPNAGHPMSVAAGSLGLRLEKQNHYCLGADFRQPDANDIRRMLTLFSSTVTLAVLLACSTRLIVGLLSLRTVS